VGTPFTFSSPDTPGMPQPSDITAMDFARPEDADGLTQLEEARSGIVTSEMKRVALREPHLSPEQIRAEVAAGRMIVPANKVHLKFTSSNRCASAGRADQDQRQHGRLARLVGHR
jgi:phosphomethylpyrimidine synthase